ncbi:MAG: hypothetical protein ABFS45_18105 [Pseudomonadota bacterium]
MPGSPIDEILNRLHALQAELEGEIDRLLSEKRERFRYNLEQGRVRFERGMQALQRRQKVGVWAYLRTARLGHLFTAPVIYSALIPFALLDATVTFYQHVRFPVYGIPRVNRADYFTIDRQHLAYLNAIEKINCAYCGYSNGLIEYVREISARTEQYWCPIKHARRTPDPHRLVVRFVDYGDADTYKARLRELRSEIAILEKVDSCVSNDRAGK